MLASWSPALAALQLLKRGSHMLSSRRVVTGTGLGELSCVTADGTAPVTGIDGYPGIEIARLWATDGDDALDTSGIERDLSPDGFYPPPGGTRFLRIAYPPGFGASAADADASRLARLLMHRTATVDYGVVLAGELTLVLEDGSENTLKAGDLIVQNGVGHGWRNTSPTSAVAVFVLIGRRS
jgi:hypothetical protein